MKEFFEEQKKNIIAFIVVSMIAALVPKVLKYWLYTTPMIGQNPIYHLLDVVCRQAAMQSNYVIYNVIWVWGAVIMFFLYLVQFLLFLCERLCEKNMEQLEKNASTFDFSTVDDYIQKTPQLIKAKWSLEQYRKTIVFFTVLIALCIGILAYSVTFTAGLLQSSFDRDVTMIEPYIEHDEEIEMLKSKWVCMSGRDDYIEIYEYINEIKEDHSLPK